VSQLAEEGLGYSDNPTFRKEYQRIVEGVPQGRAARFGVFLGKSKDCTEATWISDD
jgi:hypothetical protein